MREITIYEKYCTHLENISRYNHNYYKLPDGVYINGFNVILENCDEEYDSYEYVLGKEEQGAFTASAENPIMGCNYGSNTLKFEKFILDFDLLNKPNT